MAHVVMGGGRDGADAWGGRGREDLPVAIIGAGPIGLAAAAHVLERGGVPLVLEAGEAVGASVRGWSHVRLFSPWKYLVDPVVRRLLEAEGWSSPDPDVLPTGGELVSRLLEPLASLPRVSPHLRLGRQVESVSRRGFDKLKTSGREAAPFEVVARTPEGGEERYLARAVIDASGTWRTPNPLGSGGVAVPGEREAADRIQYGIPDVLGRDRARYAGKRVLVVGSGHSAFNAVLDLAALGAAEGAGEVVWAIRGADVRQLYGGGGKDRLEARGELGSRLERLVEAGRVVLVTGFRASAISRGADGLLVRGESGGTVGPLDEVVVTTGFRPDLSITRELRLRLDEALESPAALAPLIDPNVHSCGTVYPHGFEELSHPERDYFTVGMKSYGRAPTFLLLTGYEQVRSVAAALAGDLESARSVELELPETGVCSSDPGGGSCCSTRAESPALVTRGAAVRPPAGGSCGIAGACASAASESSLAAAGCCG